MSLVSPFSRSGHAFLLVTLGAGLGVFAACSSDPMSTPAQDAAVSEPDTSVPEEPVEAGTDAPVARDATLPQGGSVGCGLPLVGAPGTRENLTLSVGGNARVYTLTVPADYDPYRAYRLVVGLHSGGRTGASARPYLDLETRSNGSAVFVYPDAVRGNWDLETVYTQNQDIAFFDALVAELSDTLCLDKTRIFAVGTSSGAYFVNQLGCARGNVLRAIASHAGGGPFAVSGGTYDEKGRLVCPTPTIAAAIFHGLADTNVAPSEGEKAIAHWSSWNGCSDTRQPTTPSPCEAPVGCKNPVLVCKVPDQGHAIWAPGRQATWDFFASF